jgi:hypothetical protein
MPRLATPLSALAIVVASVALAACGSSSTDSSSATGATGTTGPTANGKQSAALEKFRQCLKDNGVTLPDRGQSRGGQGGPGGGYGPPPAGTNGQPSTGTDAAPPASGIPGGTPGGADNGKFRQAMQACAKLRPQGLGNRPGGYGRGQRPQQDIKAFTPYLTCLKDQSLDVKVSDGFNALRNLKQGDAKVQAAFKACQSKLPQRPGNGGAGTPPTQRGTSTGTTTS